MMRTILVPLAPGFDTEAALDAALAIAKPMNSHVRALCVHSNAEAMVTLYPDIMANAQVGRDMIERENRRLAAAARGQFESWRLKHKLPSAPVDDRLDSCFATWVEPAMEIEPAVTRFGRVSDLIVMNRFPASEPLAGRCLDAALFGTGRPTLLVPKPVRWSMLEHVVVAWNSSLEASHSVFAAMPLLRAAHRVSVFTAAESESENANSAELDEALSWYGITAHRVSRTHQAPSVGADLLASAKRVDATLIVMGAYTHGRLRQSFLGGVTRRVLEEATIPVLMTH